jgi:hypothetical protein
MTRGLHLVKTLFEWLPDGDDFGRIELGDLMKTGDSALE